MKLRMPTKLGYKNPKRIMEIFTNDSTWAATGSIGATTGSADREARRLAAIGAMGTE